MTPEERARDTVIHGTLSHGYIKIEFADDIAAALRAALAEEREACASLATEFCVGVHEGECPACDVASAIRARV